MRLHTSQASTRWCTRRIRHQVWPHEPSTWSPLPSALPHPRSAIQQRAIHPGVPPSRTTPRPTPRPEKPAVLVTWTSCRDQRRKRGRRYWSSCVSGFRRRGRSRARRHRRAWSALRHCRARWRARLCRRPERRLCDRSILRISS